MTDQTPEQQLSTVQKEIREYKRKYSASKRSREHKIIQKLLYKKYKLYVPYKYNLSHTKHDLYKVVKLMMQKAYLHGVLKQKRAEKSE